MSASADAPKPRPTVQVLREQVTEEHRKTREAAAKVVKASKAHEKSTDETSKAIRQTRSVETTKDE